MAKKFLRRTWDRYGKLGKRKKKKQKWRRPTGRDNKMREKRTGYPKVVNIGYRKEGELRGKIKGKKLAIIMNIKDIENLKEGQMAIIRKMGKKKKIEVAKIADKKKIEISNLNVKKILKELWENDEKKKENEEKRKKEKSKKEKKEERKEEDGVEKTKEKRKNET